MRIKRKGVEVQYEQRKRLKVMMVRERDGCYFSKKVIMGIFDSSKQGD